MIGSRYREYITRHPRRVWLLAVCGALIAVCLIGSRLLAQNDEGIYLPFVSTNPDSNAAQTPVATGSETATTVPNPTGQPASTPASTFTPTRTPESAQQFNQRWDPPATATPTATPLRTYPDWIPGTYNLRQRVSEGWAEYRADGTFSERHATFGSAEVRLEEGEWFVSEDGAADQFVVESTNQNGEFKRRRYILEQVGNNGFRLSAGDAKVSSFLYERATPFEAINEEYVSRWMLGRWDTVASDAFFFIEDGTYEMYEIFSFQEPEGEPAETGQWSAFADTMIIQPDGEAIANTTYTIQEVTHRYFELTDGASSDPLHKMQRTKVFPPDSMSDFEGQYIARSTTINVSKDNADSYSAEIMRNGSIIQAMGKIDANGHLVLTGDERRYEPLVPHFNSLSSSNIFLPKWLIKMSTSGLPQAENLHGLWIDIDEPAPSERWFLPDGRYVHTQSLGQTEEGRYTVNDDAITFTPTCGASTDVSYILAGNQLVFPSDFDTYTFHYVPLKLPDIVAAMNERDEQEATANFEFANTTAPLGLMSVDFTSSVTAEISADENSNDLFADAVVFAGGQLYTLPQTTLYYHDVGHSTLVPVNTTICNVGSCVGLDLTESWQDKFHYWFFPNGRVQYYSENYLNPVEVNPPIPTITRSWGKYKVEDETIVIETDTGEAIRFELTLGRRQALLDGACYQNAQ